MCGRFTLTATPDAVAEILALPEIEPFPPRYNIAPTQPILVVLGGRDVRPEANHADRRALLVRWGFIPAWAKDPREVPLLLNARSETAAEKATFRAAMRYRRCLVPASGFYEWRRPGGKARPEPFFLKPRASRPIVFAGLMETYLGPDGSEIDTAAILTTGASDDLAAIHPRMPVVVGEGDFERWLDCRGREPADVADLLAPAPSGTFEAIPVSDAVNKVANIGPQVQERVARQGPEADRSGAPDKIGDGPAQRELF